MTTHIGATPGEIAETVLLPGDPYRARWVAETFFDAPALVTEVRGMLGFTGMARGRRVTVMGTGMGMPSLSIYVNELIRDYGAKTLIRIGSCGGVADHVAVRDVVLAMTCSTTSTPSDGVFGDVRFAPAADWVLLRAAATAAKARGVAHHVGGIFSHDAFYDEREDRMATLKRHGCLAVEMEAAELYTLAARHAESHGTRALAVLTVSDHLGSGEELPPGDRERSFIDMVEVALDAAFP